MGKSNGTAAREREVETRPLQVKLKEDELLERADEMAAAELAIEQLQLERSEITGNINKKKKERAKLAHTIDLGTEERPVRCVWYEDFQKNVFRLKREDTGEEVDTRPMTALDRTGELFDTKKTDLVPPPPPRSPKQKAPRKKSKPEPLEDDVA